MVKNALSILLNRIKIVYSGRRPFDIIQLKSDCVRLQNGNFL